ncbi:LPS-assembly lipoprotein LptE [Teredinibacter purpureus]|jgi:Rare lipoprotein B|uniref:LPS-assembly lipoprotein LptE n=1 Tax=Teredinibacter purpureus TaxID=2731756 RepID=UPI001F19EE76|nr:LPS assembly lipoprotein LptE [Teredinibacter purpureus]
MGLILLLASCGWQLRGANSSLADARSGPLPPQLNVVVQSRNSKIAPVLTRILRNNNVEQIRTAPMTLVIEDEQLDKRPLSVTDTGVTAQYQLTLTLRYHYQTSSGSEGGDIRMASKKAISWRSYDFDPSLIVAKNQEEQALLVEMREELAYRILDARLE